MDDIEPLRCAAIIRWEPTPFARYSPVSCSQSVGIRGYWAQTRPTDYSGGHYVTYCPIAGHEANVRRRFAPAGGCAGNRTRDGRGLGRSMMLTTQDPELGTVRLCRGCGETWPLDSEFWYFQNGKVRDHCKACVSERRSSVRRTRTVASFLGGRRL